MTGDEVMVLPPGPIPVNAESLEVVPSRRRQGDAAARIQQAAWDKAYKNTVRMRQSKHPSANLASVGRSIGPPLSMPARDDIIVNSVAALFRRPQPANFADVEDISYGMSHLKIRDPTFAAQPPWPRSASTERRSHA